MNFLVKWFDLNEQVEEALVSRFHLLRLLRAEHMDESDFELWQSHYNKDEPMTLRSSDGYFMEIRQLL